MNSQVTPIPMRSKSSFRASILTFRCLRAGAKPRVANLYRGLYDELNLPLRLFGLCTVFAVEFLAIHMGSDGGIVDASNPVIMLVAEFVLASCATWMTIRLAEMAHEVLILKRTDPERVAIIESHKFSYRLKRFFCYFFLVGMLFAKVTLVFSNVGISQFQDLDTYGEATIDYELAMQISLLYVVSFFLHLWNSGILVIGGVGKALHAFQKFQYNSSDYSLYSTDASTLIYNLNFQVTTTPSGDHWLRYHPATGKSTLEVNGLLTDRHVQDLLSYQTNLDDNGRQAIILAARKAQLGIN